MYFISMPEFASPAWRTHLCRCHQSSSCWCLTGLQVHPLTLTGIGMCLLNSCAVESSRMTLQKMPYFHFPRGSQAFHILGTQATNSARWNRQPRNLSVSSLGLCAGLSCKRKEPRHFGKEFYNWRKGKWDEGVYIIKNFPLNKFCTYRKQLSHKCHNF